MRINPLPAGTAGRDNSPFSKEKRVKRRIAKMASESNGIKELEVCHEALKKGLISQADYDMAKQTFLRVQQLSLGFQVGMVVKEDLPAAQVSSRKRRRGDMWQRRRLWMLTNAPLFHNCRDPRRRPS